MTQTQTLRPRRARTARAHVSMRRHAGVEVLAAAALIASLTVAAPENTAVAAPVDWEDLGLAQELTVAADVAPEDLSRDTFGATPGAETFIQSGTNHDWAKLVLMYGGFPITDGNVTVFTRWMRQENGADNWWNRNNPLNNGLGSGGGGGLGSYADLDIAAQYAAQNLRRPIFSDIAAAFDAAGPTEGIEQVIWASRWASGHYANGAHWHYTPVDVVAAPASAWGR